MNLNIFKFFHVLFAIFIINTPINVFAEPLKYSLKEALAEAIKNHPELNIEDFKIQAAKAEEARARASFAPIIKGMLGAGPANEVTGNAVSSVTDNSNWGPGFLGEIEFLVPLWSFGRKGNYLRAAQGLIETKNQEKRQKLLKISRDIKEAFYGYQMASSLLDFVKDGISKIEKAIEQTNKKKRKNKEDLYRLEIFKAQVEASQADIKKGLALAKMSLAFHTGHGGKDVQPDDIWLFPEDRELKELSYYVDLAQKNKPEYLQLKAGIVAKEEYALGENKGYLPVVGFLARGGFAKTGVRDTQQSAFAFDPFNRDFAMVGIGIRWDFQWGLPSAKKQKALAESNELKAKFEMAKVGLPLLVEKSYQEVATAAEKLSALKQGYKTSKSWFSRAAMQVGSGLGDMKKIVEAYQARAKSLKDYYEAVYQHHLAWADFSLQVGIEVDPVSQ